MADSRIIGVEFAMEQIYGVDYTGKHCRQYVSEGYKFGESALCESYLCGEVGFCIKVWCRSGELDPEEFCFLFSNLDWLGTTKPDNGGDIAVDISASSTEINFSAGGSNGCKNKREPVFIYAVKFLDDG